MQYPEPLQEYALSEITQRIQRGVYPNGSKLVPQKIAESLGISSTPVVAAINRLVALGLVETIPRRGAIVKGFSSTDIRNYFDMRLMMECYSVKPALKHVDAEPELLAQMRSLVEQFDSIPPTDLETARDLETQFHTLFVRLAKNTQLDRLYEYNWSMGSLFFTYSVGKVKTDDFQLSLLEHRKILEALETKDEAQLLFMVSDHLKFLYKTID